MNEEPTNGSRVSGYELYKAMNEMESRLKERMDVSDRDFERFLNGIRGDVRSVDQTLNAKGGVMERLDRIDGPDGVLAILRTRFVYALTIIGGAIGAVIYLVFVKGGGLK